MARTVYTTLAQTIGIGAACALEHDATVAVGATQTFDLRVSALLATVASAGADVSNLRAAADPRRVAFMRAEHTAAVGRHPAGLTVRSAGTAAPAHAAVAFPAVADGTAGTAVLWVGLHINARSAAKDLTRRTGVRGA